MRQQLADESLDHLANLMASRDGDPDSYVYKSAYAEITRRQTVAELAASKAQIDAADAAKETARYTRRNAAFLLASVIVLALSSVATLGVSIWSAHDTREALVLSTKPHVDFDIGNDPDTPPVGIAITNAGPGPAVIKSIAFYVDRKSVADAYDAAVNYAHLSKVELDYQELEPKDTLAVNEKAWLIRYRKTRLNKVNPQKQEKFADFIDQNLAVYVEFCSVIREDLCWHKCSTKDRCQ